MKSATVKLVRTAVIAALYAALTLVLAPISYGAVQFRLSEALTILPLLCPEAIVGLTVGCFLANIPSGLWDMFLGALATAVAATLTRVSKKWYFGVIPPVVVNAFAVPLIIILGSGGLETTYFMTVLTVGLGQLVSSEFRFISGSTDSTADTRCSTTARGIRTKTISDNERSSLRRITRHSQSRAADSCGVYRYGACRTGACR